ncbi:MAG: sn-glycerol-3-phosphate ABC transporter ATP-binding protein UgpC [Rhodobacteraceae bacterium]|nr:sn-glycerol-3-phosphate ABC transporter ATP-binding protein UgpC [Paracoccaceae bacterium]
MADLRLESVSKSFGQEEVIHDVSLEVAHGEFIVFVGPSGCGKSTLLRLVTGLESVTSGRIFIDGVDVTHVKPSDRRVAMVFQSYALFPHLTVAENIGFGLRLAKTPAAEIRRRVAEVANTLRIEELLERKPRQLSGGQRQRVAIGRSIIRSPKVFLFDEPLSNLDAALRVLMRLEITRLHNRLQATMIFVTHDQTEAMTLADRIYVFNHGRIEQSGTPMHLYNAPANRFVAGFIGSPAMNFLPAKVRRQEDRFTAAIGSSVVPLDRSLRNLPQGEISIGVRPEHMSVVDPADGDVEATIEIVEELGAEVIAYLQIDATAEPVTVRLPPQRQVVPGQRVGVRLAHESFHLFDSDGALLG